MAVKRRTYLRRLVAFVLISTMACSASAEQAPRNVLFIAVDDLNDWIGPLGGHPQAKTPHLDRLAKQSVVFTNAHCQAPICNPSRVSLLTGTLPSTTGTYFLAPRIRQWEATKDAVTIPQHFERSGYDSWGVGKIFHGSDNKNEFAEYGGSLGSFGPRPEKPISAGHTHPLWDWGAFPERDDQMPDARIAAWASEKLKQSHAQPFFLGCGFYRPHVPLYAPQKWFDEHPRSAIQLPPYIDGDLDDISQYAQDLTWSVAAPRHQWIVDHGELEHAVQAYLACVTFVDAQVGKVLDALESSDAAENTVIVLWSDHGFQLGTKERWGKRALWEQATKVVLMISAPGMSRGTKCDRPVGLIDLYPTLIELCGLDQVTGLEGHSLVPLLEAPHANWPWPALTTFGQHNHAIRTERWRYVTYADGSEELYDRQADPNELVNLAAAPQYADVIRQHRRYLPQVNQPMAAGSAHLDARPGSVPDIDSE